MVQLGGRLQRGDAELAFEHADALPVLLDRGRPVSAGRVQGHQATVDGFSQRVHREQPAGLFDRLRGGPGGCGGLHQPLQRLGDLARQPLRLEPLPVVELRAVPQREPRQELPPHGGGSPTERFEARRAGRVRGMAVPRALGDVAAKHLDVQGQVLAAEDDRIAGRSDPPPAEAGSQRRQRAPERRAGVRVVLVRPQQHGHPFAGLRAPGHGQVREQRHGLPRVDRERHAVHQDLGRPQQRDVEPQRSSSFDGLRRAAGEAATALS